MAEKNIVEIDQQTIFNCLKNFEIENNCELKKESQLVWNAALMFCNQKIKFLNYSLKEKSDALPSPDDYLNNNYNKHSYECINYNPDKVLNILNIYILACSYFDKIVNQNGFCYFTGISIFTIFDWQGKTNRAALNPKISHILKVLYQASEESLQGKLTTPKINSIGVLAILNHSHNWNMPGIKQQEAIEQRSNNEIAASMHIAIEQKDDTN